MAARGSPKMAGTRGAKIHMREAAVSQWWPKGPTKCRAQPLASKTARSNAGLESAHRHNLRPHEALPSPLLALRRTADERVAGERQNHRSLKPMSHEAEINRGSC